jgi:hypothetical protein
LDFGYLVNKRGKYYMRLLYIMDKTGKKSESVVNWVKNIFSTKSNAETYKPGSGPYGKSAPGYIDMVKSTRKYKEESQSPESTRGGKRKANKKSKRKSNKKRKTNKKK